MPSQDAYDDMGCICFDAVVVYIYMCIVIRVTTQKKIKIIEETHFNIKFRGIDYWFFFHDLYNFVINFVCLIQFLEKNILKWIKRAIKSVKKLININ